MADPFTLISLGLGTAGALAGGIYNAATLGDRREKWKREQEENLRRSLKMDYFNSLPIPEEIRGPWAMQMKAKQGYADIKKGADENFQFDPMTFLPFVQQGTQLAGGIYDAASGGGQQSGGRAPVNAVLMAQKQAEDMRAQQERAEALQFFGNKYGSDNSWRY